MIASPFASRKPARTHGPTPNVLVILIIVIGLFFWRFNKISSDLSSEQSLTNINSYFQLFTFEKLVSILLINSFKFFSSFLNEKTIDISFIIII